MNEMKPIFKRWLLANYTSVKRFTFWKVSVKLHNCRVFVDKEVRLPWMKWNPFDEIDEIVGRASFPVPEGLGSKNPQRNETHPLRMNGGQVYECEKFRFLKC